MAESGQNPTQEAPFDDTDDFASDDGSTCTAPDDTDIWVHGRRYDQVGLYPNDERAETRLKLEHELFRLIFLNSLVFCPCDNVKDVLDVGAGTGCWANEFADKQTEASVIGVVMSKALLPELCAPNCEFQVDDLSMEWNWRKKFDLIHIQGLGRSFGNLEHTFREAFKFLKPGGYLEVKDILYTPECDDGTLKDDSPLHRWAKNRAEAATILHLSDPSRYQSMLRELGFEDIQKHVFNWPTNSWPKDEKAKLLGKYSHDIEDASLALLTRGLNLTTEEAVLTCTMARKDMENREIHVYFPLITVCARKPEHKSDEYFNTAFYGQNADGSPASTVQNGRNENGRGCQNPHSLPEPEELFPSTADNDILVGSGVVPPASDPQPTSGSRKRRRSDQSSTQPLKRQCPTRPGPQPKPPGTCKGSLEKGTHI
ncbi:S-adenosyl-L-methionine-dependent methyltransferase [Podospora didyma]|uniref:S-adenosyl-L-methionine-dependent methyltransferase n=1 Tax=Podospora didyma TaxID=330526 RepID=A0AAE0NB98_9PEZI|nr:S-adenosyl-L-methionine-dependent methyltransferase [Podospora didyma]